MQMLSLSRALLAASWSFGSSTHAADIKEKIETCKACHGDIGISQMDNVPSLAGQLDQYIQWQLVYFRSGARKNEQMQPIVEDLTNEDVRNLGAYFASLAPFKGQGRQSRSVRRRASRPPPAAAAPIVTAIISPAPRRSLALPGSARTTC